jgi:DNA helicase HerA-like ATPase
MSTPKTEKAPSTKPLDVVRETPMSVVEELDRISDQASVTAASLDPELADAVGFTHFDTGSSSDNQITVLMARADVHFFASQTLVRIKSKEDARTYLGVVTRGPFAEPDAVPPNSTMAVSVVVQGKRIHYTFDYHGRAEIEILGEEAAGKLVPPRYRPRPKSPVFILDPNESANVLGLTGDLCLGTVVGYDNMEARIRSNDKSVLPRHTGIIGTTGGGKSTTVASLIHRAQTAGIATVVFDVEGEYTAVDKPTNDAAMIEALKRRGQLPTGVKNLHLHHLVGRETTNPNHPHLHPFSLQFSRLSPYALTEILELSDAQQERFLRAYDITKVLLREFKIVPPEVAASALEMDEFTTGFPGITIDHLLDVIEAFIYCLSDAGKAEKKDKKETKSKKATSTLGAFGVGAAEEDDDEAPSGPDLRTPQFAAQRSRVVQKAGAEKSTHLVSWLALKGKLGRLRRLGIFDVKKTGAMDYGSMLEPGRVSVIDLSDTDSPQLNNLAIADILRGVQETQDERYQAAAKKGASPTPVLIIIEEAHEFLSAQRIQKMPVLFEQVARIAKRGRKRWLGLVFVTQLPQHLPNEVLGLLNNFVIHKITDATVISRMQRTIGSIDEGLWNRVSRLAPGQAVASFSGFTRPLLIAVDPAPCKRLLVD